MIPESIFDCICHHNETAQNIINTKAAGKVSSKQRIYNHILAYGHITNVEAANLLRGTKGQLSWGQRIRDVRHDLKSEGKMLDCVAKGNGVFDYVVK